jgi:hypothetical protein
MRRGLRWPTASTSTTLIHSFRESASAECPRRHSFISSLSTSCRPACDPVSNLSVNRHRHMAAVGVAVAWHHGSSFEEPFSNGGTGLDSAIRIVFRKPRLFEDILLRLLQRYNSKSSDPSATLIRSS